MERKIVRFCKKDFTENALWADLLKHFELPEDTEYLSFLPLREDVEKEITEQIEQVIKEM